jgi:hypothetical protein
LVISFFNIVPLIREFILSIIEERDYLPQGCCSFKNVSTNIEEETYAVDDGINLQEEGVCTGKYFTITGFLELVDAAARHFEATQMFEMVNQVYKHAFPIHEAYRNYPKLLKIHEKLSLAFSAIFQGDETR